MRSVCWVDIKRSVTTIDADDPLQVIKDDLDGFQNLAVEAKEGLVPKAQGMVLGSTTIQHLIALYPRVSGMTGTAATQAIEFQRVYGEARSAGGSLAAQR